MRHYESIFISPITSSEEVVNELIEKIKALIARADGEIVLNENWGDRQMAYPIKGHARGRYTRIDFVASSNLTETIQKIEELYRYSDHVIRYLTVCASKDTTVEKARTDAAAKPRLSTVAEEEAAQEQASLDSAPAH